MPWGFFRQISTFLVLLSWVFPQCSFGRSNLFPRRVPNIPMLRLTPVMPLWWVSSLSCHYAHRTLSTGSWYLISAFAPHFFHVAVGKWPPIDKTLMFSSILCLLRPFVTYVALRLGMFCDDIHTPSAHPPGGVSRTEHYIMLHKYPRTNSILPQKTHQGSPDCPLFIPHVHSY